MFDRLKAWATGRLRTEDITVLHFEHGLLKFRARRNLSNHRTVPLGVKVPGTGMESILTLTMMGREGEAYLASVVGDPAAQKRLFEMQEESGQERRRTPRQERKLRVRSKDLPGYEGVTENVSGGGARLVVEAELAPGTPLEMDVQFDHPENTTLKLYGRVVWCRPRDARTWFAGVRFEEPPAGV